MARLSPFSVVRLRTRTAWRALLLLLFLVPVVAGCRAAPETKDADPALWVVRDADTTLYLFGTIHVLKPGMAGGSGPGWFDEGVRTAFDASDTLVLEIVPPPDAELQRTITAIGAAAPGAQPLDRRIGPDLARRLDTAARAAGLSPAALTHVDPWYAAVLLSIVPARRLGYVREQGVEATLEQTARAEGKKVEGLESVTQQLGYFDTLPDDAQRVLLSSTLDELPRAETTLAQTVAAWSRGDAEALGETLNGSFGDARSAGAAALRRNLLLVRNRAWTDWIVHRMERPGTVFIAVGAGHLAGADNVRAMLVARGLRVERVRY